MSKDPAPREDKRAKFIRLAEGRTSNAIRSIRVIGNLANRLHYEFSDADVKKIMTALNKEVDAVSRKFDELATKTKAEFKL